MNNLLALFIVMYMMGVTDLTKFQKIIASFAVTFGNSAVTDAAAQTPDMIKADDMDEETLNAILAAGAGAQMPEIIPSEEEAAEEEAVEEEVPEGEASKEETAGEAEPEATEGATLAPEESVAPEETVAPAQSPKAGAGKGGGGNATLGKDGAGDAYDELVGRISDLLKAKGYDRNVSVEKGGNYIYLRFREGVLFYPDVAVMRDGANTVLSNIATVIMDSYDLISNIDISGHTARVQGNLPSKDNLFSWELSTNRALTVLEYLVKKCDMPQEKLSVTGNSCNLLLVQGKSEDQMAQNRRVEIRLTRAMTPDQSIDLSVPQAEGQT
jgi:flagellar motor protein MotB